MPPRGRLQWLRLCLRLVGMNLRCRRHQQRNAASLQCRVRRKAVEPVEPCHKRKTPVLDMRCAVSTGVNLASPRGFEPL